MPEPAAAAAPPKAALPLMVRLAISAWLLTLIAGSWSLARFDLALTAWGFFAEIRYWLGAAFLGLTALVVATASRPEKRLSRAPSWTMAVIGMHGYLAVAIVWTPDPAAAAPTLPGLVLLMAMLAATPALFGRAPEETLDFLLWVLYWLALAYVIGGMSGRWAEYGRMAAFGGGPNVFARIMGLGLIAAAYLWARSNRARWLWATPLFVYGAVMSGSRGGLLAVALTGVVYLLYLRTRVRLSLRTLGPVILSTVLLLVIQGERVLAVWRWRFVELTFQQAYGSERSQLFSEALRLFREHPIIGAGLDGFRLMGGGQYPHNIVLHVFTEGGLLGGSFLLVVAILFIRRMRERVGGAHAAFLACAGLYFVASMFSGGLYDARFVWFFGLLYMLPAMPAHDEETPARVPAATANRAADQVPGDAG